jgi:hypothetical protein
MADSAPAARQPLGIAPLVFVADALKSVVYGDRGGFIIAFVHDIAPKESQTAG